MRDLVEIMCSNLFKPNGVSSMRYDSSGGYEDLKGFVQSYILKRERDPYYALRPGKAIYHTGKTADGNLSINNPMIASFTQDLLRLYNMIGNILYSRHTNKRPKYVIDASTISPIKCMHLIKYIFKQLAVIHQIFIDEYKMADKFAILLYAQNYVQDVNFAVDSFYKKYTGFLGSAFAMKYAKDSPYFSNDWPLDKPVPMPTPQYLLNLLESSLRLFSDMAHIFYGEVSMPIIISYREEGRGGGAGFDHYNIQRITGRSTVASVAKGLDTATFDNYRESKAAPKFPKNIYYLGADECGPEDMGMIFVPGFGRSSLPLEQRPRPLRHKEKENEGSIERHVIRTAHEHQLIFDARKYHVPVLAVCGGLQTMTEAFGGEVKHLPKNKKSIHNKEMMRLLPSGELDGVNPPHTINVASGSLLYNHLHALCPPKYSAPLVNYEITSVHWFSVSRLPKSFFASAYASYLKQKGGYDIDYQVIEAMECKNPDDASEATMIAIQGHPEAMTTNHPDHPHARNYYSLFNSMADEGDSRHKIRILIKNKGSREMTLEELLDLDNDQRLVV